MMHVICFYWEGERWQEKRKLKGGFVHHLKRVGAVNRSLAEKYINNLYKGVEQFADREFKFICYTNLDLQINKDIEKRHLPFFSKKGVLPRLYMFSKKAGLFGNQVLCLDIDVVIVGSLKPLMDYKGLFCARGGFGNGRQHILDGDIMSFRAGREMEKLIWEPFISDVKGAEVLSEGGRERKWMRLKASSWADRWQFVAPGSVVSYKRHVKKNGGKIPQGASIVSCHGHPRPHQISSPYMNKYWK